MKRLRFFFLVGVCFTSAAAATPTYHIDPIGLNDPEHTRNDGYKFSWAASSNESAQVIGQSYRFNGGSANLGSSAWLYNGATTIKIGLTGPEYTSSSGYKSSRGYALNEAGQVVGYSDRYNGGVTELGTNAWLYNGVATVPMGLTSAEYTRTDGLRLSYAVRLNAAGQVSGASNRYSAIGLDLGQSSWLYNGATTVALGLADSEHTRSDGYKFSTDTDLNDAGKVLGFSDRYNGSNDYLGRSAWLYDGAATIKLGFTGPAYTAGNGYKTTYAVNYLNKAGQTAGQSLRYDVPGDVGSTAWLYNGTTTIDVGLGGPEQTRNDGLKYSAASFLNEAGQTAGISYRSNGNTFAGQSAWLYNGSTTIDIGLTGPEHTQISGDKNSTVLKLNNAGQVVGSSFRYNSGSAYLGESVWLFDGASTKNIGLVDADHTRSDGYQESVFKQYEPHQFNEAGQVIGSSERYDGDTGPGQDAWLYDGSTTTNIGLAGSQYQHSEPLQLNEAGQVIGWTLRNDNAIVPWLYDPALHQTFAMELSSGDAGFADNSISYLGDDGLVLGHYFLIDALGNAEPRAFYFTIADGLHDLGQLVDGGLAAGGWDFLADVTRVNSQGQIIGFGKLTSQSDGQMVYLLTPSSLPGDFNHDGTVDAADYVVWRKNPGGNYTQDDYNTWRTHFGQTLLTGTVSGAGTNAAVPEPATLALLIIPATGWRLRRRRAA